MRLASLATLRIKALISEIESRNLAGPRLWRDRLNRVPSSDDEILAKVIADVIAADIITDDAESVVHGSEQVSFISGSVPKYKHGRMFSEANLRLMRRIDNNLATTPEKGIFDNYINNALQRLLTGIYDREELVCNAMVEDSATYDRMGIKFTGMNWGMPAVYKVTTSVPWTNAASATPIADQLAVKQAAIDRDGKQFNRVTYSTAAFNYMIATVEFQNRVKFGMDTVQAGLLNLNYLSQDQKKALAQTMLGMTIEFNDAQTKVENKDGSKTNTRFGSPNKVVMSNTADDNNNNTWDFAIGEIIEKQVAALADVPGVGSLGDAGDFGPVGYTTLANPQLDPPGLILWAVDRGFPRKKDDAANAVLTVY